MMIHVHGQNNSRLERGHNRAGETKTPRMCTRFGSRCPVGEKLASPQQEPGEVHVETRAGRDESLNLRISQGAELKPRCAVSVFLPRVPPVAPVLPGKERSGVRLLQGALRKEEIFSAFLAVGTG